METPRSTENVVSLFGSKEKTEAKKISASPEQEQNPTRDAYEIFLEAMQRNKDNRDKLQKERLKANKGVLRSYRITDK